MNETTVKQNTYAYTNLYEELWNMSDLKDIDFKLNTKNSGLGYDFRIYLNKGENIIDIGGLLSKGIFNFIFVFNRHTNQDTSLKILINNPGNLQEKRIPKFTFDFSHLRGVPSVIETADNITRKAKDDLASQECLENKQYQINLGGSFYVDYNVNAKLKKNPNEKFEEALKKYKDTINEQPIIDESFEEESQDKNVKITEHTIKYDPKKGSYDTDLTNGINIVKFDSFLQADEKNFHLGFIFDANTDMNTKIIIYASGILKENVSVNLYLSFKHIKNSKNQKYAMKLIQELQMVLNQQFCKNEYNILITAYSNKFPNPKHAQEYFQKDRNEKMKLLNDFLEEELETINKLLKNQKPEIEPNIPEIKPEITEKPKKFLEKLKSLTLLQKIIIGLVIVLIMGFFVILIIKRNTKSQKNKSNKL